jgi:hypothetical protein
MSLNNTTQKQTLLRLLFFPVLYILQDYLITDMALPIYYWIDHYLKKKKKRSRVNLITEVILNLSFPFIILKW